MKCEIEGCKLKARFALYELNEDFTKKWVHVCDTHDKWIARTNQELRKQYSDKIWREIK